MKYFVCFLALAAFACISSADKTDKKEGTVGAAYGGAPSYGPAPSYSAPSYAPPPCPKSYLFSCQPNLAPVPCAAGGAAGGGYAGAYSEHVPQYALPMPQYMIPQYPGVPQY